MVVYKIRQKSENAPPTSTVERASVVRKVNTRTETQSQTKRYIWVNDHNGSMLSEWKDDNIDSDDDNKLMAMMMIKKRMMMLLLMLLMQENQLG